MTDCTADEVEISKLARRKLQVNFGGGAVSSDGGLLLLREVDRRLRLTERMAAVLSFVETSTLWYDQVKTLPTPVLSKLVRLGAKVARLVIRKRE